MTSRDFCYWLQGFFEVAADAVDPLELNARQVKMIRNHLNLVFVHEIDPSMPDPTGVKQAVHDGNVATKDELEKLKEAYKKDVKSLSEHVSKLSGRVGPGPARC